MKNVTVKDLEGMSKYKKIELAKSLDCDVTILEALANDESYDVRVYVTKNPNCPVDALLNLANNEGRMVRSNVAKHPNCPPELKARILGE
jgi:hypothetical protein